MKKALSAATVAIVVGALALVPATGASASGLEPEPTVCDGSLQNRVIAGDVVVQYQVDCTIKNTLVIGDILPELGSGALTLDQAVVGGSLDLEVGNGLTVRSSIVRGGLSTDEVLDGVTVSTSVIGGDVSVLGTLGPVHIGDRSASPVQRGNVIRGSLLVSQSRNGTTVDGNTVGRDASLVANRGLNVSDNLVIGTLDCRSNTPVPTGGSNTAGQALGQCAGL